MYSLFYINYVICKCLIFLAFKIISERFILTMWYVNALRYNLPSNVTDCFILTMWYVNYKAGNTTVNGITGFILTMWYVNDKLKIEYKNTLIVLY